jgi:hypothetical protein
MGLLKFTKTHSATDDGSTLTGAELGQLEADISAVLNGGISNTNIASDAAIVESKVAFNATSGHHHDGVDSRTLSSGAFRGFRQGCGVTYVTAATMKAQSGVLDIGGNLYSRTSYSTTINMATATDWVGDTGAEAASQIVYIYAYNNSASLWDIKFWLSAPQYADTGTDNSSIALYRQSGSTWYRCLGYFYNNSGQDIESKTVENIDGEIKMGALWTTDKDNVTLAKTTVYQAMTDGFVVWRHTGGDNYSYLYAETGDTSPDVERAKSSNSGALGYFTLSAPVIKDEYWTISDAGTVVIYWIPLGRF